ncbi:uncharacterized protein LOC143177325 [Calliopsis andreniformis]|uniref:uncharacterized protein LOC143177325 n=1 Tax=Calliopsis andreniformis TaxID=337506 RepID=UPI003FCED873
MKTTVVTLFCIVYFFGATEYIQGYRILAIIPSPSYSHQIPHRQLWFELAKRGHELVLITTDPYPTNFTNFKQIDISRAYSVLRQIDFIDLYFKGETWIEICEKYLQQVQFDILEMFFEHEDVKKIYAPESNLTFDLVIQEMISAPTLGAFAHRFNAPLIGVSSLPLQNYHEYLLGGVPLPSHEYTWEMEARTGSNLSFWKRLRNVIEFWKYLHMLYRDTVIRHQELVEKHFGKDIPCLHDIFRNISLIFVNQADILTPAKARLPNVIPFSSSHVKKTLDPLPEDLKRFLDDAPNGFIYFSLGTNLMGSSIPKEILQIFIDVFTKLPYKVVWKFDTELSWKSENVYTSTWLPQQSILAHPNIKLFIYQGGLQSTEEAIHFQVPVIGFPIMADQYYEISTAEALGFCKRLSLSTVTRDELESAIREVISNKMYKEKIAEVKSFINDQPYHLAENFIWWIEYVIRHKGAPHLHTNIAQQPWYQRYDMDIMVFLCIVAYLVISYLISILAKIAMHIYKHKYPPSQKQKRKTKLNINNFKLIYNQSLGMNICTFDSASNKRQNVPFITEVERLLEEFLEVAYSLKQRGTFCYLLLLHSLKSINQIPNYKSIVYANNFFKEHDIFNKKFPVVASMKTQLDSFFKNSCEITLLYTPQQVISGNSLHQPYRNETILFEDYTKSFLAHLDHLTSTIKNHEDLHSSSSQTRFSTARDSASLAHRIWFGSPHHAPQGASLKNTQTWHTRVSLISRISHTQISAMLNKKQQLYESLISHLIERRKIGLSVSLFFVQLVSELSVTTPITTTCSEPSTPVAQSPNRLITLTSSLRLGNKFAGSKAQACAETTEIAARKEGFINRDNGWGRFSDLSRGNLCSGKIVCAPCTDTLHGTRCPCNFFDETEKIDGTLASRRMQRCATVQDGLAHPSHIYRGQIRTCSPREIQPAVWLRCRAKRERTIASARLHWQMFVRWLDSPRSLSPTCTRAYNLPGEDSPTSHFVCQFQVNLVDKAIVANITWRLLLNRVRNYEFNLFYFSFGVFITDYVFRLIERSIVMGHLTMTSMRMVKNMEAAHSSTQKLHETALKELESIFHRYQRELQVIETYGQDRPEESNFSRFSCEKYRSSYKLEENSIPAASASSEQLLVIQRSSCFPGGPVKKLDKPKHEKSVSPRVTLRQATPWDFTFLARSRSKTAGKEPRWKMANRRGEGQKEAKLETETRVAAPRALLLSSEFHCSNRKRFHFCRTPIAVQIDRDPFLSGDVQSESIFMVCCLIDGLRLPHLLQYADDLFHSLFTKIGCLYLIKNVKIQDCISTKYLIYIQQCFVTRTELVTIMITLVTRCITNLMNEIQIHNNSVYLQNQLRFFISQITLNLDTIYRETASSLIYSTVKFGNQSKSPPPIQTSCHLNFLRRENYGNCDNATNILKYCDSLLLRFISILAMKITVATLLSIACFLGAVEHIQGYKILAIIPTPSYSHQIPYRALWEKIVKRGHELVLVTTNPFPTNLTNFKQIYVDGTYSDLRKIDFIQQRFEGKDWLNFIDEYMLPLGLTFCEHVFKNTEVKKMYAPESNQKFDLVIAEMLLMPSIYAFAHRFNAPLIGVTSLGTMAMNEHALGGIVLPSHDYTWEMVANTGLNLPFWKRLKNFVQLWSRVYYVYRDFVPAHQQLAEKYLGKDIPPVIEILKNTSLVFVNQPDALTPAKPKLPNMISFTSFHVQKNPDPLPEDLKRFLDEATEGFIYFSLGSNAMSSDLPKEVLQIFIEVFAKLPYRVVWKFEEELSGKPKNVYTANWLPQQSVLAHPKIKLFIFQGGLQSSEEAIHFGVPLLGLPILADQDYQTIRIDALGVGKRLEILTLKKEELESAIRELITNKIYKQKMLELRTTINDQPYDVVENLAWWVEYVIRNKGAPYYRSSLIKQPWYQRLDMDIIVFLTIVGFIIISKAISIISAIIVYACKQWRTCPSGQKQKLS